MDCLRRRTRRYDKLNRRLHYAAKAAGPKMGEEDFALKAQGWGAIVQNIIAPISPKKENVAGYRRTSLPLYLLR